MGINTTVFYQTDGTTEGTFPISLNRHEFVPLSFLKFDSKIVVL